MDIATVRAMSTKERHDLAQGAVLSAEVQELLATDPDEGVRCFLARNPRLLPDLQRRFAVTKSWYERGWLAGNKALLPELQHLLARDKDRLVRAHLASNKKLLGELRFTLAGDSQRVVRAALGANRAVALSKRFPVAFLEESLRGRELIDARIASAGLTADDVAVLRKDWAGTLEELIETAKELSAHAV